jgi:hypothetical protein
MLKLRRIIIKITHWEYWPFNVVYIPIYFYWAWLALKSKSFFFFSTSNPTIENGGFLMESKKKIYDIIPQQFYPNTILVNHNDEIESISLQISDRNLQYPMIAKPDIGLRGLQVKKMTSFDDIVDYNSKTRVSFLLQEFIEYPNEIGIFYYKIPGETIGTISGIVGKEFLTVIGDGVSTIEELIILNDRFVLQLEKLKISYEKLLYKVLSKNELYTLVPYGNHARGAKFIDLTHLVDEQLISCINNICNLIPEFYYGRLDIKYNTWEELKEGNGFSIIEVNGAGSDPTHIYDPTHSIFFAWKEIIKHLNILYRISLLNKKRLQLEFMTTKEGLAMLKANNAQIKLISKFH